MKRKPLFNSMSTLTKHTKRSLLPFLGDISVGSLGQQWPKTSGTSRGESINSLNTNSATGYFSTGHLHTKHHQIYHTSQQTTHQHSHGSSLEDTPQFYHTLQHHQFDIYPQNLLADTPSHLLHSGKSQQFPILHEADSHACSGLHRCSHHQYIIATHTSSRRFERNADAELPSTIHLPVSSDDTLHFYRYLCTHILVAEEQFLLLIDVPLQDCTRQLYPVVSWHSLEQNIWLKLLDMWWIAGLKFLWLFFIMWYFQISSIHAISSWYIASRYE